MQDLGFLDAGSNAEQRSVLEDAVRRNLDQGIPCSLCNTDHQLLAGYDEKGLIGLQPWPGSCPGYPPGRLSFGSWEELGSEIHASFFAFARCEPRPDDLVTDGLATGLDMYANPSKRSEIPYRSGLGAFDQWIAAVEKGHGSSHGNWWCGTVWSECRRMASAWMSEIASGSGKERFDYALDLSRIYSAVSANLLRASGKALDPGYKIELLREARGLEEEASSILKYMI
jgi:hypothetical protein